MNKKENQVLLSLIGDLSKEKKPIWKKVTKELSKSRRKRTEVNLSKLDDYGTEDQTILVPGKVLGAGTVSKKVSVAAFSFSDKAKQLIASAGGKAMTIQSLYKSNPEGKGVLIIK